MVWVESIANPLIVVADVPAIAAGARERGALTVVDATFATPLRQRPLELGADIVLHSATKFIGGHSDLLLGAAVCRAEAHADVRGGVPARPRVDPRRPRGVPRAPRPAHARRPARPRRGVGGGARSAPGLAPARVGVHYPGLPGDSQHERAARVLPHGCGPDALLRGRGLGRADRGVPRTAAAVRPRDEPRRRRVADRASGPLRGRRRDRRPHPLPPSVGIENVEDLWADLDAALRAAIA